MRRIWLCADDYGIAPGVNAAIRDLIGRRRINATSAMVVAPSLDGEAVKALTQINAPGAHAAIGLHLTLTAPFRPLTATHRPLRDGAFLSLGETLARAMLRQLDASALAAEVTAQFGKFAHVFGRPPDFVDGHQHVHAFPQVRDAVLAAATTFAPSAWVRQCGSATGRKLALGDPKGMLLDALSRGLRRRAVARRIITNPGFSGTYVFDPQADYAVLFPRFLDGLPDGGLVMCHPGFVDAELERLDPLTHLREREHAYLAGEPFAAALARAGVALR